MRTKRSDTWDAFHRRGDVLRAVVDEANRRRDGELPRHLSGVADSFEDDLALVAALQMRWHTRLSGHIERALDETPTDPGDAVVTGWLRAAADLPGVRMILDRSAASPSSPRMADALAKAGDKERRMLAAMAGRANLQDTLAPRIGARIEQRARAHRDAASLVA
ncbi:MAG TPA: hypothetical protein VFJ19_00950 [Nocardioidaceae bacterium]|nr:hypothetical protein [Nocardioidaceae bacterium]